MKKLAHITATAGILTLALAGCSPAQGQDADQASAADGKPSTITTQEAPKDLPEKWRYIAGTSDFTPEESTPPAPGPGGRRRQGPGGNRRQFEDYLLG
ncbi:MAG: hypothetical protein L0J68_11245, partial [Micrococcaceae bacterium]|nr:hypothetical protein [Micrococcaceae bacterium]